MNRSNINVRRVSIAAVVAALYAVLTMILAPISYGAVQCRVSEVLCVLPFFFPYTSWGLFAGCFIANLMTGNMFDIVFGSLATLGAAMCTAYFGRRTEKAMNRVLGCAMPVIFNAVIVGAVITWGYEGMNIFEHPLMFATNAMWVGLGEAAVMYILGLPMISWLPRTKWFAELCARPENQR